MEGGGGGSVWVGASTSMASVEVEAVDWDALGAYRKGVRKGMFEQVRNVYHTLRVSTCDSEGKVGINLIPNLNRFEAARRQDDPL